jgi:signal transduction histidine kinase
MACVMVDDGVPIGRDNVDPRWPDPEALVGMIGHDLRNPLHALSGWLQVLGMDESGLSAPMQRALAGAQCALVQQLRQIESLSRVLRHYFGCVAVSVSPFDVSFLVQQAGLALARRVRYATQSIDWDAGVDVPERLPLSGDGHAGLVHALVALGVHALACASEHAVLHLSVRLDPRRAVVLRLAPQPPGPSVWAVLQSPGERMSLELLDAVLMLRAHGIVLRVPTPHVDGDELELMWGAAARCGPLPRAESGLSLLENDCG